MSTVKELGLAAEQAVLDADTLRAIWVAARRVADDTFLAADKARRAYAIAAAHRDAAIAVYAAAQIEEESMAEIETEREDR